MDYRVSDTGYPSTMATWGGDTSYLPESNSGYPWHWLPPLCDTGYPFYI